MAAAFARVGTRRLRHGPKRPAWPLMYEVLSDFMRDNMLALAQLDAPAQRAWNEVMADQPSAALKQVARAPVEAGGVPGEWFEPRADLADDAPVLLYLHGGSYVFGSSRTHGDLIARLVLAAEARALALNYRLAPEHPFPAALEDTVAAYRWLLSTGVDPKRVVIAGDSAGGGLAVATLLAMREAGTVLPAAAVLIAPWVDLHCDGASMTAHEPYDWGTRAMLRAWAQWYVGSAPLDDPHISPVFAELRGLPPMLVHAGDAELLRDDVVRFADKARAAGVDVTLHVWPDMFHNFHSFHPYVKEAAPAVDEIGRYVKTHVR
jgi:acetyl esterase/lipase